ncbi:S8 family serine peptidase [Aquibium oceanicum]|uniref:Peptidase S8/S53 domain-containing protein n=1 Tax=Aquibium oceanicum TaxID=1670800 RepID=A0A1L3SS14_9HYPH|nr:S8 family serine peptidase [Aquibium oceanicum]APH72151.1 hypothetical protein BSQ44_12845 [Aquibium oceanicum]
MTTTAIGYSFAGDGGLSKAAMEKLVASDQILANMADGSAPVIVEFAMPQAAGAAADAAAADEAQISAVHQKQDEILSRVFAAEGGLSGALASDDLGIKRMDFSPMFAATVDQETLEKLAADPAVVRIHEDGLNEPYLIQSLPLIGMPTAYAAGATGSGWTVAVLDTGSRRTHEFLSSSVISAACYSTSNGTATSICPGGVSASTDINSAMDCDIATIYGCGHGTHTAGTAAGFNTSLSSGEPANGVARSSKLITINVFSRFPPSQCSNSRSNGCVLAYNSDMIKGFERVYALRNTYKIASVNVSIGGGSYSSYCDSDSRKPIIDLLRNAGIASAISAGNNSYNTNVGAPGCISSAITVASSTKSDVRSSFSNWGSLIDVVAPGSSILASYVSGSSNNFYDYLSGTSMAAPHVAGAFAALRSAKPTATVSQIEAALKATGVNISSAGTTKPRIRVDSALTYLGGGATAKAVMTSPTPGSTLGSTATFVWSAGTGVTQYWLYVGSTGAGSSNIYQASQGTSKTRTVSGLPSTGTIYVRLWSLISGTWQYNDYTYKTGGGVKAVMTSPTPGSTLGSSATFVWSAGTNVTQYWLYVGSTGAGSTNIYQASQGTSKTRTVTGLPSTGTIYVRLWSLISGTWQYNDYTYKTGGGVKAVMTSPTPGSTLGSSATFVWSAGTNVTQYWLYVGSTGAGSTNIYQASQGTSKTRTVSGLPSTGTIYVRLWSLFSGTGWQYNDYTYKAGGTAKAVMTSPTPGSTLGSSATFVWTAGTGVTQYWLYVGSTGAGSSNIYQASQGTSKSKTVTGLPSTGTIYVRLWSLFSGTGWQYNDYTYKAGGTSKAVMTSPTPGSTLGSSATFVWTAGTGVSQYWLYVGSTGAGSTNIYQASQGTNTSKTVTGLPSTGTIYVRLWSLFSGTGWQYNDYTYKAGGTAKAVMTSPTPGSTLGSSATFVWTDGTGVSQYWLYVGSTGAGSTNIYQASQGTNTSKTVTGLPSTGTIYVRLWSLFSGTGWQYNDYTYKAGGGTSTKSVLLSPANGSKLASSTKFTWSSVSGASQYWIYFGSTVGGSNYYNATQGTNTTNTFNFNGFSGQAIYMRLWTLYNGTWVYNDYNFITPGGTTGAGGASGIPSVTGVTQQSALE